MKSTLFLMLLVLFAISQQADAWRRWRIRIRWRKVAAIANILANGKRGTIYYSPSLCLSLCLSISFSLYFFLFPSIYLSFSISFSLYRSFPIFLIFSEYRFPSVPGCLCLSVSVSVSLLSIFISPSLSLCMSLFQSLPLFLYPSYLLLGCLTLSPPSLPRCLAH